VVHGHIRLRRLPCRLLIDVSKQALGQHLGDLGSLHRDNRHGITRHDTADPACGALDNTECGGLGNLFALDITQEPGERLGLLGKGIHLTGQGEHHGDPCVGARIAVQSHQESGKLIPTIGDGGLQARGILGQLVQQDKDFPMPQDLLKVIAAGCGIRGSISLHLAIQSLSTNLIGDLTPQGIRG
jgi:hypothetical protein